MEDSISSNIATLISLPRALEQSLDRSEIKTLYSDIEHVRLKIGFDEPESKRSPNAPFNPRCARLVHIVAQFNPRPNFYLLRAAILSCLDIGNRNNLPAELQTIINAAELPQPKQSSLSELLMFTQILDDVRHAHLNVNPAEVWQTLMPKIPMKAQYVENEKILTFIRAAIERYERNS